uniref:Endothelin-converting enzyme 1 n=1 Tax=Astyanax mexicanus TaxID=7994 RepID=A0A8B9HR43_ASTMX
MSGRKLRKERWTVVEVGLSVLLVAVSCALAGLCAVYVTAVRGQFGRAPRSTQSLEGCPSSRNVCTTPACVTAAARLLQNMDQDVEPCQNFYRYACGGWLDRHVIPETSSRYSVFDILRDELESILKGQSCCHIPPSAVFCGTLFSDLIEKRGAQPLLDLIDYVGGWPVASDEWNVTEGKTLHTLFFCLNIFIQIKLTSFWFCRTLRNYLIWHLVIDRVSSLSSRFKDARAQYKKALYRNTMVEARWRDCVRYVQNTMENAVGALYVKQTFAGESKRMVRELISRIQGAFVETLEELSWMDDQSKKMARQKAMAIKDQIGYPDFILEEENDKLDLEYEQLVPDFPWMIGAAVVNAFYSPNRNQIVFPAAILQPPFYSKDQLQALNFGGIGMVIGHEITHGFDDNGRNFDKDGNMLNWWSNFSAEHFRAQSQCMVQQYGNFTWDLAGGQKVCGVSTLGENIADNGGVRQAYKAYKKWRETEGEEPYLPGLNLNNDQLFFLNFGQVWCGTYRAEYASHSIRTDSHSPLDYRVLGSLQNFDAFSEAFHCKPGSPMNPPVKCRVW